jgi:hypothetical protein
VLSVSPVKKQQAGLGIMPLCVWRKEDVSKGLSCLDVRDEVTRASIQEHRYSDPVEILPFTMKRSG